MTSLSTFLNSREATQLRGLAWLSLSDTGSLLTETAVSDSGGGATSSWAAGTAVPCRIDPVGQAGQSSVLAGRIDERSTHVVTVPLGVTVTTNDRFSIAGRGTFEVTAARDQTSASSYAFEVLQIS